MSEKFYTVKALCELLSMDENTVTGYLRGSRGKVKLKGFKVGGQWRVTQTDLESWIEKLKSLEET